MSYKQRLIIKGLQLITLTLMMPNSGIVHAGEYLDSAHGSNSYGVNRPSMTGYATGNCGHCHDMHGSVSGEEPAPISGTPNEYTLFAKNFDTGASPGFYEESDNFCFYCHNSSASVQGVTNGDYATTFGGGITGTLPQSIMAAVNQTSFHNLDDIHTFINNNSSLFPWYNDYSNPCNSCHNPHLAKRNYTDFSEPLASAMSKPSDHFNLWGETDLMSSYSSYVPPYANATTQVYEPDSSNTANGTKTPDYVGFCTDCHNSTNTIFSTNLNRNLLDIDWENSGDKHGSAMRDVGLDSLEPYTTATSTKSNLILSCLDCHEPHGSSSIMLLRRRVNGINGDAITTTDNMSPLCGSCHTDDDTANAGTNAAEEWQYVHHLAPDAPYTTNLHPCVQCHKFGVVDQVRQPKIPCGNCHFHGSTDSWLGSESLEHQTNRKTF